MLYRPNNIEFRVASAAAIGEFKTAQAHTFLQVCRREFEFGLSAKEVVLLSYDRFSHWLFDIERDFLDASHKQTSQALIDKLVSLFHGELQVIEQICADNPEIFSKSIQEYVKCIHGYAAEDMQLVISQVADNKPSKAFIAVSECLTDYLQHLLLAMHEYNNNLVLRNAPFLCIGRYSLLPKKDGYSSITERAAFFREVLGPHQTFIIKNFTDEALEESVISALEKSGIIAHAEVLV
jgi:hypothetical protein